MDEMDLNMYQEGFEEDHSIRSEFVRMLTLRQLNAGASHRAERGLASEPVPKTLVRFWNDLTDLPRDVEECFASWNRLKYVGFDVLTFCDVSAAAFIGESLGPDHSAAFARCCHPAMRSDYLRLCFLLVHGGFYVDADDVLLSENLDSLFLNANLKLHPLCYDLASKEMLSTRDVLRPELETSQRIFYVNNDPILAPAGHAVIRRALARATRRLLEDGSHEIQATTGPGNLTAAMVAHARELLLEGAPLDFEFLSNWDEVAETRWELDYRKDDRNWRNWTPVRHRRY